MAQIINTDLNPLMVEETQEVKWCKVNALLSIDYDFVAGRSVMKTQTLKVSEYLEYLFPFVWVMWADESSTI